MLKGWVELFSLLDSKVKKLTEPYCIQYTLSCCDKIWEDALKTCLLFCISRKLGQSISWEGGIISSLFFYYVDFLPFIITFSHKNILNIDTAKNVKIFICSLLFLGKNPINSPEYCISSYSFRANYIFLNLETVENSCRKFRMFIL